jgi:hypothetical protein
VTVHKYVIYDLGIHSQIPLWGECVPECAADITISLESTQRVTQPADVERGARDDAEEIRLAWPDICEMSIRRGTHIVVRTGPDPEPTYLRHLVSGIGLGLALHQRGVFTLHAGAVGIDGRAVAIMGHKGAGKSTLAAALRARGHSLLSDDVVALEFADGAPPRVRVGAPNMNLWPDSALAIGHDPSVFSPICGASPKLAGWVPDRRPEEPVELAAIVVLSSEPGVPRTQKLGPVDCFTQLLTHSHAFRWIPDPQDRPRHLAHCRQVLQHVPVLKLCRGESLGSLSALTALVEELVVGRSFAAIDQPFASAYA